MDSYLIESNIREEARLKVEAEKEKEADGAALPWKIKKAEEGKEGKRGKNWKERAPRWHVAQSACHEEAWSVDARGKASQSHHWSLSELIDDWFRRPGIA